MSNTKPVTPADVRTFLARADRFHAHFESAVNKLSRKLDEKDGGPELDDLERALFWFIYNSAESLNELLQLLASAKSDEEEIVEKLYEIYNGIIKVRAVPLRPIIRGENKPPANSAGPA